MRKLIVTLGLSALAAAIMPALPAVAAAGQLDVSFSDDGKLTHDFGENGSFEAMGLQSGNKIVVASTGASGTDELIMLTRFNSDGSVDTSFGTGGTEETVLQDVSAINDLAIQDDDYIVVVGSVAEVAGSHGFVARFTDQGVADATFGTGGVATFTAGAYTFGDGVALGPDGEVVAAGTAGDGLDNDWVIAHLSDTGVPSASFNGDGIRTLDWGIDDSDQGYGVAVQDDGKVVAVGQASLDDSGFARFNADGSLDTSGDGDPGVSFSANGKLLDSIGSGQDVAKTVIVDGTDLVVAGTANTGDSDDFYAVKLDSQGEYVNGFGTSGIATFDLDGANGSDLMQDMAIQSNGKLVMVGEHTPDGGSERFGIFRTTAGGGRDNTFAGDGAAFFNFGAARNSDAESVAIQPNGKIVASGHTTDSDTFDQDGAMLRLQGDEITYRPDLMHRRGTPFRGDNVYNTTGAGQKVEVRASGGETVEFRLRIQNDGGTIDTFKLKGNDAETGFSVTYLVDGNNVTDAVIAGTRRVRDMAPGDWVNMSVKIHVGGGTDAGLFQKIRLVATSLGNGSKDAVVCKVTSRG